MKARFVHCCALWVCGSLMAHTISAQPLGPWVLRYPLPSDQSPSAIAYGQGRFVAVGNFGTILTSQDAASWTNRPIGLANQLNAITYGKGQFVAVGMVEPYPPKFFSNLVATSSDAVNWQLRTLTSGARFTGVAYGNGLYVAVGPKDIWTSPDAISWTRRYQATNANPSLQAVAYGQGVFAAVGTGGDSHFRRRGGLGCPGDWTAA